MSKALYKDTIRSIKKSFSRFISIIAIVALGTCFFAGIKSVSPDMRLTANDYFVDKQLMDIRVISPLGLTDYDAKKISEIGGVKAVMPSKMVDALVNIDGKGLTSVDGSLFSCRVLSIDLKNTTKSGEKSDSYLNGMNLVEGRYPQNANECVVDGCRATVPKDFAVGQKITLAGDGENIASTLKKTEFTIVGIVESPEFISFERGNTLIGSGKLGGFMYVSDEAFCTDYYTNIDVSVEGSEKYSTYSKEYKNFIAPIVEKIESVSAECLSSRAQVLRETLPQKIQSGRAELSVKEEEVNKKLAEALKQVEEIKYYAENGEQVLEEKRSEAEEQLSKAKAEYEAGEKKYSTGLAEYNRNLEEYKKGVELASKTPNARDDYYKAVKALDTAKLRLSTAKDGINMLKKAIKSIEDGLKTEEGEKSYKEMVDSLIDAGIIEKNDALSKEELSQKLVKIKTELVKSEKFYEEGMKEYNAGKIELDKASAEIKKLDELDAAGVLLKQANTKLTKAYDELVSAKSKIDIAQMKFDYEVRQAEDDLKKAKENFATVDEQYRQKKSEIEGTLQNARYDLNSAENILNSIDGAKWVLNDRNDLPGYESYNQTAQNMQAFATVFPLFFFMLAALICLTTMTRMVEEERVQLGTLKALGYTAGAIVSKYVIYAALATLIGCAIGLSVGFTLLPIAIYNSYGLLFTLPPLSLKFYFGYALTGILVSLIATVAASLYACRNELTACPARLMRPKAPKAGKRVSLEKITFIWKRLNFTSKVTVRNLFRNKKRFVMTVVGIAGCTSLLLTGFGLGGSIGAILPGQYGENGISQYDFQIALDKPLESVFEQTDAVAAIRTDSRIDSTTLTYFKSLSATSEKTEEIFDVNLIVPENGDSLSEFIKLQNRKSGESLSLKNGAVLITEKLAKKTGTKIGDEILVKNNNQTIALTVTGITENYAYHYIYVSGDIYEKNFGETVKYNSLLGKLSSAVSSLEKGERDSQKNALATDLMKIDGVTAVVYNTQIMETFGSTIKTLNAVIVTVFCGAAGALAFVVLYNLTNININERIRELATIKVLGFYDKEVSEYIYRENVILTLLGIALGLVLGIPIHSYVVSVAEVNIVMFGRSIEWTSFVFSALISLSFAVIVNFMMHFKMKKISMVESMKSVE